MKTVSLILTFSLLLTCSCAGTRSHLVTQDDRELGEFSRTIDNNEVSVYLTNGTRYDDARLQSITMDSTRFLWRGNAFTVGTGTILRIVEEGSDIGITVGIVGGAAVGILTSFAYGISASGNSSEWGRAALVGGAFGLLAGGAITIQVRK